MLTDVSPLRATCLVLLVCGAPTLIPGGGYADTSSGPRARLEDGRHGLVTLNPDQSITYTPDAGFTGIDDLVYFIEDARGGRARGFVSIQVEE